MKKIKVEQYICVAEKIGRDNTCVFSRDGEPLKEFQNRMDSIFPVFEGWYVYYSKWNRL